MALNLHNILVGIVGLISEDIARSRPDCDDVRSLFIPRHLTHTGPRDARALVFADGLLALEPAIIMQSEFEYLDG